MNKPTCCKKMISELKADVLICYMTKIPFTTESQTPKIYLQSDGGHGGMSKINFCPWCGRIFHE